ncbi:MAG: phage tail sheath family protein, partial [Sedimenticola sp.]|nr:phage tail sheath family protein [Sedimenticola sp.]
RYLFAHHIAIMIEKSINQGTELTVFDPNDHLLWSTLKNSVSNFMQTLFRESVFPGSTTRDAYFVKCRRGNHDPV